MGDVLGHEVRQLGLGGLVPGLEHDERLGQLTRLFVGDADHRDIGDGRMGDEQRFELGRRHLEALVLDELLHPIDDVDVAGRRRSEPRHRCAASRRRRWWRRWPRRC